MSELRETIARIIDPEAWEPWEGYPIGQRAALEKADLVLALPQLAETSAAVGVLLEYDGEFDTGYRFIKTGDTPRPEWLRGVTTTPLFALPQLASVGRDSSSQSQPVSGSVPSPAREAEPSAARGLPERVVVQSAVVGPYHFICSYRTIGLSTDRPEWDVSVGGGFLGGRYATLEDAMRAALAHDQTASLPNTPLSAGKDG